MEYPYRPDIAEGRPGIAEDENTFIRKFNDLVDLARGLLNAIV